MPQSFAIKFEDYNHYTKCDIKLGMKSIAEIAIFYDMIKLNYVFPMHIVKGFSTTDSYMP